MKETKKPHYLGHRQRLKEKLARDSRSLADYEILELALALVIPRRDTKPLAKELIERFGSLKDAIMARPALLSDIKGIGPSVLAQWALIQEVFARVGEASTRSKAPLSNPTEVAKAAMARIGNKGTEEFWVAFLDTKNRVIAWEQVSKGTIDATPVSPRNHGRRTSVRSREHHPRPQPPRRRPVPVHGGHNAHRPHSGNRHRP